MHDVASTILAQLGGPRFRMMTGARNFLGMTDALQFDLPRATGQVNRVTVRLDSADTYTLTSAKRTRKNGLPNFETLETVNDVYVNNLREVFTQMTGLHTSL